MAIGCGLRSFKGLFGIVTFSERLRKGYDEGFKINPKISGVRESYEAALKETDQQGIKDVVRTLLKERGENL